ncbi:MAG: hypothetical protein WD648_05950 [Planctomycetaceae bacterium]
MTRTVRQIEDVRKATARIQVHDGHGRPCAGVHVSVEQESHEFLFACVVPDLSSLSDETHCRYNTRLHEVFNQIWRADPQSARDPQTTLVDATNCDGKHERIHLSVLRRELDRLAVGGHKLSVLVSRRTVGMCLSPSERESETPTDREIGARVADLYTLCFSHPSVHAIIWSGIADGDAPVANMPSIHQQDLPTCGLLRGDLTPKYAFQVLRKLISTVWHTRAHGETDINGLFQFRGFFGNYRVVVAAGKSDAMIATLSMCRVADEPRTMLVEIPAEAGGGKRGE